MLVQVGSVVHVVAAQDTMTANFTDGMSILVLGWTFRISSGVSEGIDKSVVQGDRKFLNVGVGGRH